MLKEYTEGKIVTNRKLYYFEGKELNFILPKGMISWNPVFLKTGRYQPKNLELVCRLLGRSRILGKDIIIYDVGANFGVNSLNYARYSDLVFSFELVKLLFDILVENVRINNLTKKVIAQHCAVGSENKERVEIMIDSTGIEKSHVITGKEKIKSDTVKMITLDSVSEILKVDPTFIKIDTEGYDLNVILGAKDIIRRAKPIIQIEVSTTDWRRYGLKFEDLFSVMYDLGYTDLPIAPNMKEVDVKAISGKKHFMDIFWLPDKSLLKEKEISLEVKRIELF